MKLNKIAATAAMAGALGSAALGIGAVLAQADPNGPNVPGPGPGPNVPGQGQLPGPNGPGQGQLPAQGQPICNPGAPGVNCNVPGSPLPPGQDRGQGLAPPPGHYNEPTRYGLPASWDPNPQELPPRDYPVVYDPARGQWGVNANGTWYAYDGAQVGTGNGTGAGTSTGVGGGTGAGITGPGT